MTQENTVRRGAGTLLALILAIVITGCAGTGPGYETPTVNVTTFRAVPSSGAVPSFEIGLRVINPNRQALELQGMSYTVRLDGYEIIKGVANQLPVIEPYGEGTFAVTASVSLLAGIRLLTELMSSPKNNFGYELEAKLDPGGFGRRIRIRDSGEVSLSSNRR